MAVEERKNSQEKLKAHHDDDDFDLDEAEGNDLAEEESEDHAHLNPYERAEKPRSYSNEL